MTCIINNGSAYDNDFSWKPCDHLEIFVFVGATNVKPREINEIPPTQYYFKDFGEILEGNCKPERL